MPGPQKINLEPEIDLEDEEEEPSLPSPVEEIAPAPDATAAAAAASGAEVIVRYAKLAPPAPGVYRMVDARGDVLYVGKAKNIRKRILAYQRLTGHTARIARMIAATAASEFVSTATETGALLLEAHQIKRCSGPCTGEVKPADYAELVREAKAFLSGKSRIVKEQLAGEMEKAASALDFERAAIYRDRLAGLSAVQAHQGINPRSVEEADVFAVHQEGGFS